MKALFSAPGSHNGRMHPPWFDMSAFTIWVFSLYAGMSVITAAAYVWDKSRARRAARIRANPAPDGPRWAAGRARRWPRGLYQGFLSKGYGANMTIMERNLKFVVFAEDGAHVARCLDVEVASEGDTKEEAIANLQEALELYFEDHSAGLADLPPRTYQFGEVAVHA
ncbi:MAG: type II toxin-antitoxin system HicB family antitoxin [Sulfuricellaceae bacterium]|nr:type II toxin-antitoxin system HicB family antitoxin [Sulfuricellaceae bacterium]